MHANPVRVFLIPLVPSMNILDQALPIVHRLKQIWPNSLCLAIIDSSREVPRVFGGTDLLALLEEIGDGTLVFSNSGRFRLFRRTQDAWLYALMSRLLNKTFPRQPPRGSLTDPRPIGIGEFVRLAGKKDHGAVRTVILSDPKVLTRHHHLSSSLKKFVPHAWILRAHGSGGGEGEAETLGGLTGRIAFLADSREESRKIAKKFCLEPDQVRVTEPPNIGDAWTRHLSQKFNPKLPQNYIYLLSSPSNPSRFTFGEKVKAVSCVANLCNQNGLGLVIRLHPKESRLKSRAIVAIVKIRSPRGRVIVDNCPAFIAGSKARALVLFSTSFTEMVIKIGKPAILYRPASARTHWPFEWQDSQGRVLAPGEVLGVYESAFDCDQLQDWFEHNVVLKSEPSGGDWAKNCGSGSNAKSRKAASEAILDLVR